MGTRTNKSTREPSRGKPVEKTVARPCEFCYKRLPANAPLIPFFADARPMAKTLPDAEFKLNLRFGESRRQVVVRSPMAPMTRGDLLPILQAFDNEVVTLAEEESARLEKPISCCAGCGACCRQLVPIAAPEANRLAAVVAAMPEERRAEIERRFAAAVEAMKAAELYDQLPTAHTIPDEATRGEFGLKYFRVGVACPFLENESCGIYPDRPLACREFLVTSPAENCKNPSAESIVRVPLPAQLSETLYRFSATGERQAAHWFPLILALEFAAEHAADSEPKLRGGEFVQKFLTQLSSPPPKKQPT